jgi:hypothetical protein
MQIYVWQYSNVLPINCIACTSWNTMENVLSFSKLQTTWTRANNNKPHGLKETKNQQTNYDKLTPQFSHYILIFRFYHNFQSLVSHGQHEKKAL